MYTVYLIMGGTNSCESLRSKIDRRKNSIDRATRSTRSCKEGVEIDWKEHPVSGGSVISTRS